MSDKPLISFDYAIKYILKNKGDYEIIERFISTLLQTQGYPPVTINALLDSESNKESFDLKRSIADLVVQDKDDNKYIVEIERSFTPNFFHKACFNSSRLIVDSISGNQDYTSIKKVFHISLLYFATQNMKSPLYHGQTIFHEIDTTHPVNVKIANQGLIMFETPNVFPEYFIISLPRFNDQVQQELDEWLYMMKHSEVLPSFKSPVMKKVAERLAVIHMSNEERNTYFAYLKEAVHSQDVLLAATEKGKKEGFEKGIEQGIEKGLEKGREEGREEERLDMAKRLLQSGQTIEFVAQMTGLDEKTLTALKDAQKTS
jgi:predicted transposase/invertase (TIGR01784 family)